MKFFHNAPKRKKTRGRRKKRRTAAQRRATKKMLAARRRQLAGKSKPKSRKRRRRTTSTRRSTMARRKRKSTRRRRPVARRRRYTRRRRGGTIRFRRVRGAVYQRNPAILNMLTRGVMDAAVVVGGKAVSGFIGSKIPQFVPGTLGAVLNRVVSAVVVGFAASRVLSADRARLAVAGALAAPIESAIKGANIPLISEGLSDDEDYYEVDMSGYPGIAGYPGMSGYPAVGAGAAGLSGDEEYEYEYAAG